MTPSPTLSVRLTIFTIVRVSIFVNEAYILQNNLVYKVFIVYIIRWFRGKFVPLQPEIVRRDYSVLLNINKII